MKVNEIFYSIQGEGISTGTPAVFLRLALCNLRCEWCDTPFTWNFERYDYHEEVHEMSPQEILRKLAKYPCKRLVVTGGEPLLQQEELIPLLGKLKRGGYFVEVETNGTIVPEDSLCRVVNQWNVSPKLTASSNPRKAREKMESYEFFRNLEDAWFKFVVASAEEVKEAGNLVAKYDIPQSRVLLMPQARTRRQLAARSRWLVEQCKTYGFRFSPRLHIALWGNRRGI